MIKIKLLISLLLACSFTIVFCICDFYLSEAQEPYKTPVSLSNDFVDVNNSEIGIQIKYPENWTVKYTPGNNNSKSMSDESFKGFNESLREYYKNLNNYDSYQIFLQYINNDCGFISDCRFIEDKHLQSYMIDSKNLIPFMSIFDYLPSLIFFSPIENSTDGFLENVKIASFVLPYNYTLNEFLNYYLNYLKKIRSIDIQDNCQFYILDYHGCEINYMFTVGNNMGYTQYESLEFFIEKNNKIYLISFNLLSETYLKYIELLQKMLESIKLF